MQPIRDDETYRGDELAKYFGYRHPISFGNWARRVGIPGVRIGKGSSFSGKAINDHIRQQIASNQEGGASATDEAVAG